MPRRPEFPEQFTLKLSTEADDDIRHLAGMDGVTVGEIVRRAVDQYRHRRQTALSKDIQ